MEYIDKNNNTNSRSSISSQDSTITDKSQDDNSYFYSIHSEKSVAPSLKNDFVIQFPEMVHPQDTAQYKSANITIVEGTPFPKANVDTTKHEPVRRWFTPLIETSYYKWIYRQCTDSNNRYAFQMCIAFSLSASLVMIQPVSSVFPNPFWVCVSVVTVLDNTVGGFLNLSIQRLLGTFLGGAGSIIILTSTRAIFHPNWEWPAALVLGILMFIQIFYFSKMKMNAKLGYAGNIGLLTTAIIVLSDYDSFTRDCILSATKKGFWRTLDLVIGIVIALIVALFVFPLKASSVMRKNLGEAFENAADLYEKSSAYYLDFSGSTTDAVDETLATAYPSSRDSKIRTNKPNDGPNNHDEVHNLTKFLTRTFSTRPPGRDLHADINQQMEEMNSFWKHDGIMMISNEAFKILATLQTESTRLRNVSNESWMHMILHIFGGGKERCKRDMRRAKRYDASIEAMKRIVWPLVSFRLLLPIISLSNQQMGQIDTLQHRLKPTKETLQSFRDSLAVMRRIGTIMKDTTRPIGEFPDDWLEIDRMVTSGNYLIQRELRQTIKACTFSRDLDGLKLLSYYGFLVRCSMIWDGLKTVVEKLSPLNGSISRASSVGFVTPLPNREVLHVIT